MTDDILALGDETRAGEDRARSRAGHNVACGPSIGGLRMAPDISTLECARLARAMTLKNAAAGLAHGGGKSVLYGDLPYQYFLVLKARSPKMSRR